MRNLCQLVLVGMIMLLVITGLNTSNDAINQLTAHQRAPVIAVQYKQETIHMQLAGEEYKLSLDRLTKTSTGETLSFKKIYHDTIRYLQKIWLIFQVLFLT